MLRLVSGVRCAVSALAGLLLISACRDASTPAGAPVGDDTGQRAIGLVEITITGIGNQTPVASVRSIGGGTQPRQIAPVIPSETRERASTPPVGRMLTPVGSIQLEPVSSASFTMGTRGAGGYRYVSATYRVRNANPAGTPYGGPRQNLTFVAVNQTSGTLAGTSVSKLFTYGGTAANPLLARDLSPTGLVTLGPNGDLLSLGPDVLQAFTEDEVAAVGAISGVESILPYGFVVRPSYLGPNYVNRDLPVPTDPAQFDGVVTFAFKFPLQGTAADDPFSISARFLAVDDNEMWFTQSRDELLSVNGDGLFTTLVNGSPKVRVFDNGNTENGVCYLRTAGTRDFPAIHLVNLADVVSRTPVPFTPGTIGATDPLSLQLAELYGAPIQNRFIVNSFLSGQLFHGLPFDQQPDGSVTTPNGSFKAGEEIEVTLARAPNDAATDGFCRRSASTARFRVETQPAAAEFAASAMLLGSNGHALGDFNGDGLLDLANTSGFSSLEVRLGSGGGAFGSPATYDAGGGFSYFASAVAVGDVNNDGFADLVVGHSASVPAGITTFLGDGTGAFAAGPVASAPRALDLVLGDVNRDGNLDLVAASQSPDVFVMLGLGDGSFVMGPGSPFGAASDALQVALGDVNQDGVLDIAVADRTVGSISLYVGDGAGAFAPGASFSETYPNGVLLADLDEDGSLDLAASTISGPHVRLGQGDGTFGGIVFGGSGLVTRRLAVGDFDGDSHQDLLQVAEQGSYELRLLIGSGNGTFIESPNSPFQSLNLFCGVAAGITAADITGDGRLDFLSMDHCGSQVQVHRNVTSPAFKVIGAVATSSTTVDVTFAAAPTLFQAQTAGFYFIPGLTVNTAVLSGNVVTLTTTTQNNAGYTVTVIGVTRASDSESLTRSTADFTGTPTFNLADVQSLDNTHVAVVFDAVPVEAQAETPGNYVIPGLTVSGAEMTGPVVTLTTTSQQGIAYDVTVGGISRAADGEPLTGSIGGFVGTSTFNVASAVSTSYSTVEVSFDAAPVTVTAEDEANYTITGLTVLDAQISGNTVILTTSTQSNAAYTVQVAGVTRLSDGAALFLAAADFDGTPPPAPVANDDVYPHAVTGNVSVNSLTVLNVLTNDAAPEITSVTASTLSLHGGNVVMTTTGPHMGRFTYDPPAGYTGADQFDYTVWSPGGDDNGTVSLTVSGMVWFINADAGVNGDGRLSHPFNVLSSAPSAAGASIFLYAATNPYVGPITLTNNQKLLGQDATVNVATMTGITTGLSSASFPIVSPFDGAVVTIAGGSGGVVLAGGASATLRGFTIATTGGTALSSGSTFGTLTVADLTINASGGGALALRGGAVSGSMESVSSSGGVNGISLKAVSGSLAMNGGAISGASGVTVYDSAGTATVTYAGTVTQVAAAGLARITGRSASTLDIQGTLTCNTSCQGITVTGNSGGTIRFSSPAKTLTTGTNAAVTATTNIGTAVEFTNGGLAISTSSGTGLTATGGGTLTVSGTNNTINATGAQGLALNSVTVGANGMTFVGVTSGGGSNNVGIVNVGNVTGSSIVLGSGGLSGASSTAINITGGTADISYSGSVTKTAAGLIVNVDSRSANVTLGGTLSCSTSCTGLNVSNLSGTAVATFSGNNSTLSTGASSAVTLSTNATGTVLFSGNTLALTTSTGTAFNATGSGTVRVTGTANTITTTSSGVALKVDNVTIGTGGLNFRSIATGTVSAGNGANGIYLNNTGSTAGLTVAGNAGVCTNVTPTCTGGHIRGTVGADGTANGIGIYLNSTRSPSLARMQIDGTHQNFGIYANGVANGLTLDNIVMNGTFGTNAAPLEGAMTLVELSGTGTVTSGYFANGKFNNVRVQTTSVTLTNLTFSGTTFGVTQSAGNASLEVEALGGTSTVTVNGNSSFTGGHEANLEYQPNGGTSTVVVQNSAFTNTQASGSTTFSSFSLVSGYNGTDPTGTGNYTIDNNDMIGATSAAISINKDRGSQNLVGSITNNRIGNGTANSGAGLEGIIIVHAASGSNRTVIDNNTIRNYNATAGIRSLFAQPTGGALANNGSMHLRITRNTLTNPNTTAGVNVDGIRLNPNTSSGAHTLCVNLGHGGGNANSLNGSFTGAGAPFAFGPVLAGGTGFFKMAGLSTLTSPGVRTLGENDNGVTPSTGFVNLSNVTIQSDLGAGGAVCNIP